MHEESPFVFVVDDDASIRDSLGDLIGSAGLNVQTFASAQEFLTTQRPDAAGCLVLDVQLPGLSGLELQQELAKVNVRLPIIFITGHGDIPMTVRAMKAGASEFLTKPFRDADLLNAIEQAIDCGRQSKQYKTKPIERVQETQPREIVGSARASSMRHSWPPTQGLFRKEGEYWTLGYAGHLCRLKDARGLAHLAQLLRSPGREFHALDLVRGSATGPLAGRDAEATGASKGQVREAGLHIGNLGDAGEWLDQQAKASYRHRLAELREELQAAKALGHIARAEAAEREIEALVAELAHATGLGGRDRRAASAAERARQSVSRAIKLAVDKITGHLPELGHHLARSIKTGTYCCYTPDPQGAITWDFTGKEWDVALASPHEGALGNGATSSYTNAPPSMRVGARLAALPQTAFVNRQ
jgi:FixJ family two-component response regulator